MFPYGSEIKAVNYQTRKGKLQKKMIDCVMPSAGPQGAAHDTGILFLVFWESLFLELPHGNALGITQGISAASNVDLTHRTVVWLALIGGTVWLALL